MNVLNPLPVAIHFLILDQTAFLNVNAILFIMVARAMSPCEVPYKLGQLSKEIITVPEYVFAPLQR